MGTSITHPTADLKVARGGDFSRRLLSVPQVAAMISVSSRTVWSWIYARKIPFIKIGGSVRIDLNELERVLDAGTVPAIER